MSRVIAIVGLSALARGLGVSYQAIRKWEKVGRLPRTEWTGETNYGTVIEKLTGGKVTRAALLGVRNAGRGARQEREATA